MLAKQERMTDVKSRDIIQIVQQFLYENNLMETLKTLEKESNIDFTSKSNKSKVAQSAEASSIDNNQELRIVGFIKKGDYKSTLKELQYFGDLKSKYLIDLYEQIILEWIGDGYKDAARELLRKTDPMDILRSTDPDRYVHLESLLSKSGNSNEGLLENRDAKRRKIAKDLEQHLQLIPPSRLLSLIHQAIKWQVSQKMINPEEPYDLLRDQVPRLQSGDDEPVQSLFKTIKFPKKSHAEAVSFSPDGKYLVVGTVDGFIEVYNYLTGKLRTDLKYQADENMIIIESACLCLSFDRTSSLLASGGQDGSISIWDISTGSLVKSIPSAHLQGVSALCFNKEGTQILSSSFDQTIKIHGLKSGKVLKVFRGHSSFVNTAAYSADESAIISGSSDGSVKIWNLATTDCISNLSLVEGKLLAKAVNVRSIHTIVPTRIPDVFLVSNHSKFLYMINIRGRLVKSFELKEKGEATGAILSCNNDYLYVTTERELVCLSTETSAVVSSANVSKDGEIIGVEHHPFSNLLSVYTDDGIIFLYK